ncbi:glycosyltransferase family 4 protein [Candidatus Thioglobus sp.]|nr:glycosyltransferase family 4 protein [Candidatus Thioglobus sp.]
MKILISSFSFHPNVNGISNVTIEHAKYFLSKGHEVTVVTSYDQDRSFKNINGIEILEFKLKGSPLLYNFYRGEIFKYISFLKHAIYEYDLIYFHGWQVWATDLFLFVKSKQSSAKVVMVSHCSPITTWSTIPELVRAFLILPYRALVMPILMKKFNGLVFLSDKVDGDRQWDYRYALKKHLNNKIHIIPNGMPKIDEHLNISDTCALFMKKIGNAKILLYVANYDRVKNQKLAIEVLSRINTTTNHHLVFIGSDFNKHSDNLLKIIKNKKLENRVSVLSNLSRKEVLSFFSISYMTLFTSNSECYPLSVLESLAYKKPVVATDIGCISRIPSIMVSNNISLLTEEVELLLDNNSYYSSKVKEISGKNKLPTWPETMKNYDNFMLD